MKEYKEKNLLSIIIPVFNGGKTIERCINSLINQTYKLIEIIIIDDCSNDNTKKKIEKYQKRYPNKIKYSHLKKKEGTGGARNKGLSIAKGKYIGFVDSDDWVDSNLYYEVIYQIEANDMDIAIFGIKNEYENSRSSQIRYVYQHTNIIDHIYALNLLSRSYNNDTYISPMVCQKVFKKDFIEKNNLMFILHNYYEDDYFSFKSFLCESKIIFVSNVYYHYYQNPKSITHTFSKKHIDDLINFFVCLRKELECESVFLTYKLEYFSYFDKCVCSTIERLFLSEPDVTVQKKYITYLLENMKNAFSIKEWIDYLDIQRVKRLFE